MSVLAVGNPDSISQHESCFICRLLESPINLSNAELQLGPGSQAICLMSEDQLCVILALPSDFLERGT